MTIEQIKLKLEEFRTIFLGKNFVWRKGQQDVIIEVIKTYFDKSKNVVIIDAPVGSGKSLIGMAVAWILNEQKLKGYILASDLSLQEQYEKDFDRFNLHWG